MRPALLSATRVARGVIEGMLVLIVVMLLAALGRQMAAIGWTFMDRTNTYAFDVASQIAEGAMPYRDFAFEYPPLALLPLVLPYLAGGLDVHGYFTMLAAENVVVVLATAGCVAYLAKRGWSAHGVGRTLAFYALLVAATPILFWRFDSVPALLSVVALCAVATGRQVAAGIALGIGGLVKLYPLLLLPVFGLRDVLSGRWHQGLSLVAATALSTSLGVLAVTAAVGAGGLSFLGYHAARGIQLESVPASIGLLAYLFGGPPVRPVLDFGAWQLESPFVDALGWLWLAILGLLGGGALIVSAVARYIDEIRTGSVRPQTQIAHLLAAILLFILAYRVLSPQFLVWLLPFAALLPRGRVMLLVAVCALSTYLYPFGYDALVALQAPAILALTLRNLLLLSLFVWLVAPGVSLGLSQVVSRSGSIDRDGVRRRIVG